jgi:hypothetical protein
MNGRLFRALCALFPRSGPYLSRRLLGALAASCLLHAAVVFLPYLGASTTDLRPAVPGGQKPGPARILNVRLMHESEPAPAGAANPPDQRAADEGPRPAQERARGIDLLPIPAPAFYTADQLTKRPQPTSEPRLDVPEQAPNFSSGKAILKLWINELGNVIAVDVEKSDLPEAVAATAAAAFAKLRFVPGEIDGRPVRTLMRIEVTYDDGTQAPP